MWLRFSFTFSPVPSLHTPFLGPVPSAITPEDYIHVPPPIRTYRKSLVSSTVTPIHIHADSPSTFFQMSAVQPSPAGFVYIIAVNITFVNMNIFQIHEVSYIYYIITLVTLFHSISNL
jgi:hypothetical protein